MDVERQCQAHHVVLGGGGKASTSNRKNLMLTFTVAPGMHLFFQIGAKRPSLSLICTGWDMHRAELQDARLDQDPRRCGSADSSPFLAHGNPPSTFATGLRCRAETRQRPRRLERIEN